MNGDEIQCRNCLYWDNRLSDSSNGMCRRYAPKHEKAATESDAATRYYKVLWPMTKNDDWCAEFDRK